jgi:integrase
MRKLEFIIQNVPANVPVKITIAVDHNRHSPVKLYIPKENGKPSLKKRWYVYYYFRSPISGRMEKQMDHCGINKYKTTLERTEVGRSWLNAYELLLSQGFNPFDADGVKPGEFTGKFFSVKSGLWHAFDNLKGQWKQATVDDYKTRLGLFLQWASDRKIDTLDIGRLEEVHLIAFMNWLTKPKPEGRGVGLTSQGNYKRCLSGLLGKLVRDRIIAENPIAAIETRKNKPLKNTPFTGNQVKEISQYLRNHDPQLYRYIQFVVYEFLRPREVVRLRVGDFDYNERYMILETKTEGKSVVRLISPIIDYLGEINIESLPKKANLFTNTGKFEVWTATEKAKTDHFGLRFRKVKDHFDLGDQYGIYSFRHTAALDLYNRFLSDGGTHSEAVRRLMPIIRHTSEKTTETYLREIGAQLPKDYGAFYTLDF